LMRMSWVCKGWDFWVPRSWDSARPMTCRGAP